MISDVKTNVFKSDKDNQSVGKKDEEQDIKPKADSPRPIWHDGLFAIHLTAFLLAFSSGVLLTYYGNLLESIVSMLSTVKEDPYELVSPWKNTLSGYDNLYWQSGVVKHLGIAILTICTFTLAGVYAFLPFVANLTSSLPGQTFIREILQWEVGAAERMADMKSEAALWATKTTPTMTAPTDKFTEQSYFDPHGWQASILSEDAYKQAYNKAPGGAKKSEVSADLEYTQDGSSEGLFSARTENFSESYSDDFSFLPDEFED